MMGVYQIRNTINDKLYVGSSYNMNRRKYCHFSNLKYNKHPNKHLQRAYNLYGPLSFVFEELEFCSQEQLLEREQYWVDTLWTSGRLYNKIRVVTANWRGKLHSKSTRQKMKDWQAIHGNAMKKKGYHDESSKQLISISNTKNFAHRRRLTEEQVKEVVRLHDTGLGMLKIGKKYGVSKPTIQRILRGTRYRLVPRS